MATSEGIPSSIDIEFLELNDNPYIGGENLTNHKQKQPIIGADNPWAHTFEPTLVYAPITGITGYIGIRINIGHRL